MEKISKRFLLKIETEVKFLKGISFINPRASLARAAFKRDFLINLKAILFFGSRLRKVKFMGISYKSG